MQMLSKALWMNFFLKFLYVFRLKLNNRRPRNMDIVSREMATFISYA